MGISQALSWVAELGFDGMDFLLDSKIVVDAFNGGNKHNTKIDIIIQHCRQVFSNFFHSHVVEFGRRQANEVAHELAEKTPLNASSNCLLMSRHVSMTYYLMKYYKWFSFKKILNNNINNSIE